MWPFRKRPPVSRALEVRIGSPNEVGPRHNALKREIQSLRKEQTDGVTASGMKVRNEGANYLRRLIQPWQIRALGYYDLLGEVKYSAQFYARSLANLELFAAEIDEDGSKVPTENPQVKEALDRIKDPGGTGRKGLLADYGRLMFLTGEALLFVSTNPTTEKEQWEMLSTDELRLLDGSYTRFLAPSLPAMTFTPAPDDAYVPVGQTRNTATGWLEGEYDQTAVAYRLWKRHPRFSMLPDSPMEGVLELCEELVLLTHAVRARARSRLAGSGVLFIDDRITTRPQEAEPDEDVLEDPFLEDLTEAMTLPITDEGTASAVVPLLARVKVPDGMKLQDLVYHLQIIDPTQLYPETGLRMECIRRIAICLDMPAEILLGLGDLNHWNVWGIDEQSWKYHVQPIAEHLVADLTSAYLGPYLKSQGVKDWDRYCIDYDASKIINHPDRSKDFFQAHDRAVIGDEALRDAIGATEDDKPTQEEIARIIGMKVNDGALAYYGTPAPRGGSLEVAPGEIVRPGAGGGQAGAPQESTGASTEKGPPPQGPEQAEEGVGLTSAARIVEGTAAMLAGAAGMGVLRAREAAGSRIRTLARYDRETLDLIDGVSPRDVAAVVGRTKVRELSGGAKETELMAPSRGLMMELCRQYGCTADVSAEITETLIRHAARTLYEQKFTILPANFTEYIIGLLGATR